MNINPDRQTKAPNNPNYSKPNPLEQNQSEDSTSTVITGRIALVQHVFPTGSYHWKYQQKGNEEKVGGPYA